MTPVSFGLILLGLITFIWPLATLLCKRDVLNAQWLIMLAMTLLGISFILLGCMFNTFLQGEYILLMLFLDVTLVSPPVIHIALTVLTHRETPGLSVRALFLPSILCILAMIASSMIGGADMYRLWTLRGAQGLPWQFIPGNWHYNLIVVANTYLYWAVFSFEFLFILVNGTRQFIHFKRINDEYYTADRFRGLNLKRIYLMANAGIIVLVISQFTQPFLPGRHYIFYLTYFAPLSVLLFDIGRSVYMINNSAERFHGVRPRDRHDLAGLAHQIEDYVEQQRAFLNPHLSVFLLAEQLHTSEDDIIDAIHFSQGVPFGEYIDALRIQYAASAISGGSLDMSNPDTLLHLAYQSGYLTTDDFEQAWLRILHVPFSRSKLVY